MSEPRNSVSEELPTWFQAEAREDCERLKYGRCSTLACLKRGGYVRGNVEGEAVYDRATCFHYEAIDRLTAAKSGVGITDEMVGWKLVPIEPTAEMQRAAFAEAKGSEPTDDEPGHVGGHPYSVYQVMLAAAPPPPTSDGGRE